jgi:hypothetical protein
MRGLVNPGGATGSAPDAGHIGRLKEVVRTAHRLDADAPVLVQQLACAEPGCPPVETVVAALGPPRRTWKFPKPTADVSPSELRAAIVNHPEGCTHVDHD